MIFPQGRSEKAEEVANQQGLLRTTAERYQRLLHLLPTQAYGIFATQLTQPSEIHELFTGQLAEFDALEASHHALEVEQVLWKRPGRLGQVFHLGCSELRAIEQRSLWLAQAFL